VGVDFFVKTTGTFQNYSIPPIREPQEAQEDHFILLDSLDSIVSINQDNSSYIDGGQEKKFTEKK
jgi:hypothetical protein